MQLNCPSPNQAILTSEVVWLQLLSVLPSLNVYEIQEDKWKSQLASCPVFCKQWLLFTQGLTETSFLKPGEVDRHNMKNKAFF